VDPLGLFVAAVLATPGGLPPLADTLYLPPFEACRENRLAANRNYNRLRGEWNEGPDQPFYEAAIGDSYKRWLIWDAAEDAAGTHHQDDYRRTRLARLKELLGPADYRHMRLPEPVAGWHLSDETTLPRRSHEPPPEEETPD
jgi:hypothetical protein